MKAGKHNSYFVILRLANLKLIVEYIHNKKMFKIPALRFFVFDNTGFNGWLSLPPDLITELNLTWKRRGRAVLGDGSECVFNVYEAVLIWDGNFLTIPIDEADSEPLVGMSLMEGYQLTVQVFEGGRVELSKVATI
jgi:clan AA aspartic protease